MLRLALLTCLIYLTHCEDDLMHSLSNKINEIYDETRTLRQGELFRYTLPENTVYEIDDESKPSSLPQWLFHDTQKNILEGFPTQLNDIRLRFKKLSSDTGLNNVEEVRYLNLKAKKGESEKLMQCKNEEHTSFVGSIIFYDNINRLSGQERIRFMKRFANRVDTKARRLHVEEGNRMDNQDFMEQNIVMSGPGNQISMKEKVEPKMFTVSWNVKCGKDLAGNEVIHQLNSLSQNEDFSSHFEAPVLGWFVTESRKRHNVRRRAIGAAGSTPRASATTPAIVASPSTDTQPTFVVKPSPSKSMPTMMSTAAPTPANRAPTVQNPMGEIRVFSQQALQKKVAPDVFHDEDRDALNIQIKYSPDSKSYVQAPEWIVYNDKSIYLLPPANLSGALQFSLVATDPEGLYVHDLFTISITENNIFNTNIFNVTIDEDFSEYKNSVEKQVKLVQKLATAMDEEKGYTEMRPVEFSEGSVVVNWGVSKKGFNQCNNPEVQAYLGKLQGQDFNQNMEPILVKSVSMTRSGACPTPTPIPVDDSPELWETILIPVIVIVIILLIIALVLCCVYRRRRKFEPKDDDEYGRNQKKPVIFREEYDEKQSDLVSLQPKVLPNEKPPNPTAYEPRSGSPDEPGSSNEEETLLAPGSPQVSNGRIGYNAPPPYTPR